MTIAEMPALPAWRAITGIFQRILPIINNSKLIPIAIRNNIFHKSAFELSEIGQQNIRILRNWAKSKGWVKLPNHLGTPEKWGVYIDGKLEWRLMLGVRPSNY